MMNPIKRLLLVIFLNGNIKIGQKYNILLILQNGF